MLRLFPITLLDCFYCTNEAAQHEADEWKRKIMALFIQFHYKTEVYYERTVQVELPVSSLL